MLIFAGKNTPTHTKDKKNNEAKSHKNQHDENGAKKETPGGKTNKNFNKAEQTKLADNAPLKANNALLKVEPPKRNKPTSMGSPNKSAVGILPRRRVLL